MTDDFTVDDVLLKFKVQVKTFADRLNLLDQQLSVNKNPTNPTTYQETLEIKNNIINGTTSLLKEMKPLDNPNFRSLTSIKLLKLYEKISAESVLLLNRIKHDDEEIIENTDRFNKLSIFIKDVNQEVDHCVAKNTVDAELEEKVDQQFVECISDLRSILAQLNPSSALDETLTLFLTSKNAWEDIENFPRLTRQCIELHKNGFVVQNEENKNLFKLNL